MITISQDVYILEREFRFLIELIFLKRYGLEWYEKYFKDSSKEKDRSEGRPEVIKYIYNPLDNRNFVDLKNFVEDEIKLSKNTMLEKLDKISELLEGLDTKKEEKHYNEILEHLKGIRDLSEFRVSKVSGFDIYNHITPELSEDWQRLYYSYRNPWAHNYCLLTYSELNDFQELSKGVLTKIRTEVTLLSLLRERDSVNYPDNANGDIYLTFEKIIRSGSPICRLQLQIDTEEKRFILELLEATYKDLLRILKILAIYIEDQEIINDINIVEFNPFLLEKIKSIANNTLTNPSLIEKIKLNFKEVEELFEKESTHFTFNVLERSTAVKKADLSEYLSKIHNNN